MNENHVTIIKTTCEKVKLNPRKYIEMLECGIKIEDIVILMDNDRENKEKKTREVYYITGTKEQHRRLEEYMMTRNIEYQINEDELFMDDLDEMIKEDIERKRNEIINER